MNRAEMIEMASPPCRRCGSPIQCVEQRWRRGEDGEWHVSAFMICTKGHRIRVET